MEVVKSKRLEGCIAGNNVYDLLLSDSISYEFIEYIAQLGKLIYKPEMEKPFFSVIIRGKMTLKGVQSNRSIRVLLPEIAGAEPIDELTEYIRNFNI